MHVPKRFATKLAHERQGGLVTGHIVNNARQCSMSAIDSMTMSAPMPE